MLYYIYIYILYFAFFVSGLVLQSNEALHILNANTLYRSHTVSAEYTFAPLKK